MGVLKEQSTLTIAVWSSILLHTVIVMGFELAFFNSSKPFPKLKPQTITLLSVELEPIVVADKKLSAPPSVVKKTVLDELLPTKKELPIIQFKKNLTSDFITDYVESDNYAQIPNQFSNREIPIENHHGESLQEIKEAVPVRRIVPVYPFRSRKEGLEGIVSLEVLISHTGNPLSCFVLDSSGYKDLDKAAVKTVLASRFHPGTVNGEEVESTLHILIEFQLYDL